MKPTTIIYTSKKQLLRFTFLICTLLSFSNTGFAQTDKETKKERRLLKKKRLTTFLQQPYFFAGFGGDFSVGIPMTRMNESVDLVDSRIVLNNSASLGISFRAFLGFQIKKHSVSLQYEELFLPIRIAINQIGNNATALDLKGNYSNPYVSALYQYNVLSSNCIIGLQPGLHLGAVFSNVNNYTTDLVSTPHLNYSFNEQKLRNVAFGFGPSLNLEVHATRWLSVNLYQKLSYVIGAMTQSNLIFQFSDETPILVMTKSSIFNYSVNISLRFKMYMKGTKQKVNDLMK